MIRRGRRRRGGWRRKGKGLQAYVRLHGGRGGLATRSYPLATKPRDMQKWIDDTCQEYRRRHPRPEKGTLAADVARDYLPLLVNRPQLQADRGRYFAWWCERFGTRARWSLEALELETALNELLASGAAASSVKHHRTALYHLFTKLDGKNAPNPLRDVPPPRQPDPMPRWIPADIVEQIFATMPDYRYARKLTVADAEAVRIAASRPDANRSAIARAHGISETMVRKIVGGRSVTYGKRSKAKARLRVMVTVGLPQQIMMQLQPQDVDLERASLVAHGRQKGGGTRPVRLPLTPAGVIAMRGFIEAEAFGTFSTEGAQRVLRRAIASLCDQLEADPDTTKIGASLRAQLAGVRAYDFRHSFLTEAQLATGNIRATQGLAMHTDIRQTLRYTLAAVAPELQAAADALAARQAGQRAAIDAPPPDRPLASHAVPERVHERSSEPPSSTRGNGKREP